LEPTSAPGCDNPTSRCQTTPSIWSLGSDKPVIPGVPFIRWAMVVSTQNHRITITDFRPCLICQFYSQASIYYYALKIDLFQSELTFSTPPVLFRRWPPQSNYPSYNVFKKFSNKNILRVVSHCCLNYLPK